MNHSSALSFRRVWRDDRLPSEFRNFGRAIPVTAARELPACSVGQQGWGGRRRAAKQEGLGRSYYYHNFRLNAPLQLLPPPPPPPSLSLL